ncbi:MAG: hypothetical protein K2M17_01455, partial [Bacilli bacterium]|nr:hypothetical protein [Bacilli bacterium]
MDFLKDLFKYEDDTEISGLTEELCNLYFLKLYEQKKQNILIVANSLYEANRIYNGITTYTEDVSIFPMDDFLSSMIVAESPELKFKRLETLDKFINKEKGIVITNLMGYLKHLPSKNVNNAIIINKNQEIKRESLAQNLNDLGYKKESLVTQTGEYAIRGFIVDVFPMNEEHPIRIEFDSNNIESIRYFDEDSQMSLNAIENIKIQAI